MGRPVRQRRLPAIFILRLIPLVPCDVINYGAGLGSVRYRDFILATAVGIIPGCLLYAAAGTGLTDLNPVPLVFGFGGLIALGVIPWWLKRRKAAAETKLDSAT
ncbi:MAG: TVP38/TMEM64 family protein [Planctomycetota bacterium]